MFARNLSSIIHPSSCDLKVPDSPILQLATDSRRVVDAGGVLFFAIRTRRNDGARYTGQLYRQGVRNFVMDQASASEVSDEVGTWQDANVWYVDDVVLALQQLAAFHRLQFSIPVVGITGSNGKTVVKDWLVRLLSPDCEVVASPRSYNSQIGVPLSVWQLDSRHGIAIFEAGISMPGEMERLQQVIQPTVGILTNISTAHDENFASRREKLDEKLRLFVQCEYLIYCSDDDAIRTAVHENGLADHVRLLSWGSHPTDSLCLMRRQVGKQHTTLSLCWQGTHRFEVSIPFTDRAATENVMHCIVLMLHRGLSTGEVALRCASLSTEMTRLQLDEAVGGCLLIHDNYRLDLDALANALDFMQQESLHTHRTLILSDFEQPGVSEEETLLRVVALARWSGIDRFVGVGTGMVRHSRLFAEFNGVCYPSTDDFIQQCDWSSFRNQTILLKGLRRFQFDRVAKMLRRRTHETVMQVDLSAMVHNLNYYRSLVRPTTKMMAMVKASSYGAGQSEVASVLQYHHVDYLTVAYIDEGVELRRSGITVPIMVMNPEVGGFEEMIAYRLEPDIYSFRILDAYAKALRQQDELTSKMPVHLEVDTGMHRLGFAEADLPQLVRRLSEPDCPVRVASFFSHLACSEDASMDDFTRCQIDTFRRCCAVMKEGLHRDDLCCHILNSSGITRFPEAQMDMVRLGIGLYGISPEPRIQAHLRPVSRLLTHISQIKSIPEGESVGYNCRWVAARNSRIAILSIGYADGLSRNLGYGHGCVVIGGLQAPIIGSVCMDMCFVDVTDVPCDEGDEVVLFGDATLLQQMASAANTIAYEILTSVSPRVKRVYYQE